MIYTSLYVMIFDACRSITGASGKGLGPGNLEFFGPQMALAYQLDAISHGPKNSWFPGPNPLSLSHVMDLHASKTLRTVPCYSYYGWARSNSFPHGLYRLLWFEWWRMLLYKFYFPAAGHDSSLQQLSSLCQVRRYAMHFTASITAQV